MMIANSLMETGKSIAAMGKKDFSSDLRLMVFSPWCYGHHPTYLRHLISSWCQWQLSGVLDIVVNQQFLREHADVVELGQQCDRQNVQFIAMTTQEQEDLEAATSGLKRALEQHKLISRYASQLGSTKGLIIYFDSCLISLVLGLKLPCPFSGIYYRPTFHYPLFTKSIPTWKERVQHLRERVSLWRVLHHPQFRTLFCLDPIAVEKIATSKVIYLPDPVQIEKDIAFRSEQMIDNLRIEPNRKIFLFFGRLAEWRKGVPQLVEAVSYLPYEIQQQMCLLFVGEPDPKPLEAWLTPIKKSGVQIVTRYNYVPEAEIYSYFQLADIVLAPYQRHVGMSGILLQAAAANKPVLSSNYGLMGEMVKRYGLGIAVDSTDPREISAGLIRCLTEEQDSLCDRARMQAFVVENSVERFAHTILHNI
jgi:glycosyltransferase involved in cell wall biosynthesis